MTSMFGKCSDTGFGDDSDDTTLILSCSENDSDVVDGIVADLQEELYHPFSSVSGYVLMIFVLIFIDEISFDALLSAFGSVLLASLFTLVGLHLKIGTDLYVLLSVSNGLLASIVGLFNRVNYLDVIDKGSSISELTTREIYLMKREVGCEMFCLSVIMMVLGLELSIVSLQRVMRSNLERCKKIQEREV